MNDKGVKTTICLFWLNLPLSSLFPFSPHPYILILFLPLLKIYIYINIFIIFFFLCYFFFLKSAKKGVFRGKQAFACFCNFPKQPFACFYLAHFQYHTKHKQPFACFLKKSKQPFACFACFCLFFVKVYRVSWRQQPACSCREPLRISV